ncbi:MULTISPECIES: GNAT family N-acetyltransferase [Bacillaceae]|uniref:GNAT family N-acetyltransferase n=1 Tax=Metabacillus sediminis TaxID=3117746 RepID=A0ABZ2NKB3_9BACI|nr:GNAT family N-acetyltransferase [Bacillus sp. SJS]KZZ83751.1 acetyltransferase [Bacillus sp. SJS]
MEIRKLQNHEDAPIDLLLQADPSERQIRKYLERGSCFIALLSDSVIGECVLLPTRPGTAELVNIAVSAPHQGKGIGKKLVLHAIEQARLQGSHAIEIGTGNSSIDQIALYQKCGFRITGIDRDYFIRHYEEKIYENGIQCVDMVRLAMDL